MTFFEDLSKKLGETAETVTNKAGEAMEIQKLKGQIRTLARGNAEDLIALGDAVYKEYKDGAAVSDETKAICEAIKDREASIEEYEKKISDIKGDVACAACGKTVSRDMSYCPYCGGKMPEKEDYEAEDYAEVVKEKAEDMAEDAKDKAADVLENMADAAGNMADKADDVIDAMKDKAEDAAEALKEKAEDAAEKLKGDE